MAKKQKTRLVIQVVEYLVSGGAYFWVGYGAFAYFWSVLHWSLWWATIISNIIGWTVNYLLQRFWVFNNSSLKGHKTETTGRYIFITLVDFLLNYLILYSLQKVGITPYIGQFISSGFFTVWNYFWYRFWVFPEKFKKKKSKMKVSRVIAHRAHGHSAFHLG